jgi:outer membrane immunogenic protein
MTRTLLLASAALGVAILPLGAANAADLIAPVTPFNWSGFYAGIHGGWLSGDVNVHEEYEGGGGNISGPIFGLLAGVNFFYLPAAPWVLGVEADFGWADIHGSGVGDGGSDCSPTYLYDLNWNGHARLRASYPMMGGATPFVAAGLAVADLNITDACYHEQVGGLFVGGTIGAGVDIHAGQFNAPPNLMLRGEVLYDFYHTKHYEDYSVDFSSWTARLALIWLLQ